jgi:hypothetical protein
MRPGKRTGAQMKAVPTAPNYTGREALARFGRNVEKPLPSPTMRDAPRET